MKVRKKRFFRFLLDTTISLAIVSIVGLIWFYFMKPHNASDNPIHTGFFAIGLLVLTGGYLFVLGSILRNFIFSMQLIDETD